MINPKGQLASKPTGVFGFSPPDVGDARQLELQVGTVGESARWEMKQCKDGNQGWMGLESTGKALWIQALENAAFDQKSHQKPGFDEKR